MQSTLLHPTALTRAGGRARLACARALWLLCLAALWLPGWALAAFTVTRTSAPLMYIDSGLNGAYVAYKVTSSTAVADIWVDINSFTGGVVSLAPNEDGIVHLGALSVGQTKAAYFYVQASGATAAAQGHTISVYGARPPGAALASATFSLSSVSETISAAANKVNAVVTGPDPAGLGGVITMTVTGDTGSLGAASILSFSPATFTTWRADVFELFDAQITLPGGTVLDNQLYVAGYGTGGAYTLVYKFKAVGTTTAPTAISPVGNISSGTQIKHTSTSNFGALPPIATPNNSITVAKSVLTASPTGGNSLSYRLRFTNSGSQVVSLERIVDDLPTAPATPAVLSGTSTWGGAAAPNPAQSGAQLTWSGDYTVPAASFRDLVFQVTLPLNPGTYDNKAVAYIGSTKLDTTLTGSASTTSSAGSVTVSDTLPAGLTPTAASGTGWGCGIAGQTVTCTRSDALAVGASYPALSISVNVSLSAGSPLANTVTMAGGRMAAITGLPSFAAPGSTVTATVTCTNSGGSAASNATCAASGLPSGGTVTCTPTSPQATLAIGASINCAVSYTALANGVVTLRASTGSTGDGTISRFANQRRRCFHDREGAWSRSLTTPHPADRAHQKREPDELHLHTYASPRPPERRATHL